ncbi:MULTISPECIES: TIGR01457 family HAD-type hydrolase [Paenibacillus]|uniref:TIGR01457 family HAD-type hydrolase n=1 Tax=Paenibacillus TaxID=44249 RepID=UPI000B85AD36|nr:MULTISPECIES: TIGR01457 family HAD-type hydrolase [Paenibacillus]MBD8836639.1 TIGR01457 family HAD-type hydrolase [Paenibacillus sp. CFBP 13594]MCP1427442.1 4-nitrophenyl phosphatase [Paenibacillus xylanexedens]PRA04879.1 TIGR01457 family HAD-type hydrolase [Paenibacillus sp. MYb63]PRA47776.1 TIGR01457 family HAD-type hydrolase [Paenibacillus sp. MYb67]QZN74755.1 TIGR01457 family HAD-type hydrolase [Paenibacillus sp. DR312]
MIKAYLIDLDGTLYHGRHRIEGADQLIRTLQELGKPYLFVTNNSSRTPQGVADHLNGMGIPADASQVCTSAVAAAEYVAEESPGAKVACIGEAGLLEAIEEAGLQLTEDAPDYVIQGIDREFSYHKLTKALRWINAGSKFIMTNPDLQLPSDDGLTPGAGTIGAAIEAATGVHPTVIGKPSSVIMKSAISRLNLASHEVAVIGDNMRTDIAAGVAAGCETLLVLTGVTTRDNMDGHIQAAKARPDHVFEDLHKLMEWLSQEADQASKKG